ncbi:hypothetical protein BDN72DRAFT_861789 [Pluteus cervinus]|uniref:Uncharacterized protein n=1 Tax=Pluteus cervinus TaxID=181527 RepID=A0ACD3AE98_9AGAR|nr:hypothetical protein BDN72DRAFT_861789 [Pluteus cervinus]
MSPVPWKHGSSFEPTTQFMVDLATGAASYTFSSLPWGGPIHNIRYPLPTPSPAQGAKNLEGFIAQYTEFLLKKIELPITMRPNSQRFDAWLLHCMLPEGATLDFNIHCIHLLGVILLDRSSQDLHEIGRYYSLLTKMTPYNPNASDYLDWTCDDPLQLLINEVVRHRAREEGAQPQLGVIDALLGIEMVLNLSLNRQETAPFMKVARDKLYDDFVLPHTLLAIGDGDHNALVELLISSLWDVNQRKRIFIISKSVEVVGQVMTTTRGCVDYGRDDLHKREPIRYRPE